MIYFRKEIVYNWHINSQIDTRYADRLAGVVFYVYGSAGRFPRTLFCALPRPIVPPVTR